MFTSLKTFSDFFLDVSKMTASIQFDETTIFEGFTVSYKLSDNLSKTIILAECFRRLENVLDSLNLHKLKGLMKNQCFVIHRSIEQLKDGDTLFISCLTSS